MKTIFFSFFLILFLGTIQAQVAIKIPIIWRDSIPKMNADFWATYPKKEKDANCPLCRAVAKQKWKVVASEIRHYLQKINGKSRYSSMEKFAKLQFWLCAKPCVQWAVLTGQLPTVVPAQGAMNVQFGLAATSATTAKPQKIVLRFGTKIYSVTKEGIMPEDLVFVRLVE